MQQAVDVVTTLQLGVKALQFYSPDHPRVVEALTNLEQACATLLAERSRVSLTASKGAILLDGAPLPAATVHTRTLAAELERRQLGGIVLLAGVRRQELLELTRLLTVRPEQLHGADGAEEMLQRAAVEHVRISRVRYEAVTADEEVVWSATVRRGEADPTAAQSLPSLLRQYLMQKTASEDDGDQLRQALTAATSTAAGQPVPPQDVLREALAELEPVAQLALLVSLDRLPQGEAREALRSAAVDPMQTLLATLSGNDEQLSLLRDRLADLGISREQLDEILEVMTWDKLTFDERIAKLSTGSRIFDFPADKFLRFVRELLDAGRNADVRGLLGRYAAGLAHDAVFVRRTVCSTLGQVALLVRQPGFPRDVEQLVGTALLNYVMTEKDVALTRTIGDAAGNFIAMLVATGRNEPALRVLARFDHAIAEAPPDAPVRLAVEAIVESFGEAHRAAAFVAQSVSADPDSFARYVVPLLTRAGGAASPALIEALSSEEDRNRRGRLVKALKTIGEPAYPHLIDTLRSPAWFVVRNALNVLGDIGRPEHVEAIAKRLDHGDPRVRRAAARALGKIGGPEAEAHLVGAIEDRDEETQAEVLMCLGAMKAQSAVPALAELTRVKLIGAEEKVKELAITALGQIGTDEAVNVLGEIVRPRGIFSRPTPAIKAAAIRALSTIQTPAARNLLRESS
jgi:hypothetical protein